MPRVGISVGNRILGSRIVDEEKRTLGHVVIFEDKDDGICLDS